MRGHLSDFTQLYERTGEEHDKGMTSPWVSCQVTSARSADSFRAINLTSNIGVKKAVDLCCAEFARRCRDYDNIYGPWRQHEKFMITNAFVNSYFPKLVVCVYAANEGGG